MHLPKFVYEALPYFYLLVGAVLVVVLESPITFASGVLFYLAGAAVWVVRSSHRRKNSSKQIENRHGRFVFPEMLYEYLPFAYMGVAIILASMFAHPIAYLSAAVLGFAGLLVWMIRAIYRSQAVQEAAS